MKRNKGGGHCTRAAQVQSAAACLEKPGKYGAEKHGEGLLASCLSRVSSKLALAVLRSMDLLPPPVPAGWDA